MISKDVILNLMKGNDFDFVDSIKESLELRVEGEIQIETKFIAENLITEMSPGHKQMVDDAMNGKTDADTGADEIDTTTPKKSVNGAAGGDVNGKTARPKNPTKDDDRDDFNQVGDFDDDAKKDKNKKFKMKFAFIESQRVDENGNALNKLKKNVIMAAKGNNSNPESIIHNMDRNKSSLDHFGEKKGKFEKDNQKTLHDFAKTNLKKGRAANKFDQRSYSANVGKTKVVNDTSNPKEFWKKYDGVENRIKNSNKKISVHAESLDEDVKLERYDKNAFRIINDQKHIIGMVLKHTNNKWGVYDENEKRLNKLLFNTPADALKWWKAEPINEEENGYICFYPIGRKQVEVRSDTSYHAQQKAAEMMKVSPKNRHMISVKLAEKDGKQVTHNTNEI